jgi:hypothetical protein
MSRSTPEVHGDRNRVAEEQVVADLARFVG